MGQRLLRVVASEKGGSTSSCSREWQQLTISIQEFWYRINSLAMMLILRIQI